MRRNVLVVGAAGFIGSRLVRRGKFDQCDIKTGWDIREGVKKDYSVVVFLAADLGNSETSYAYNLELFSALVSAFAGRKHPHIIYTSSAAVYGDMPYIASELFWGGALTPYGKAKLQGEFIIKSFFEDYTFLRLSNVVGNGDGHGVCDIFQNGGQLIFGDGEQTRDYIHVERVVDAILTIVKKPKSFSGEVCNLSSGIGQTVNSIFAQYSDGAPVYEPARDFDVPYSVLDNTHAKELGLL